MVKDHEVCMGLGFGFCASRANSLVQVLIFLLQLLTSESNCCNLIADVCEEVWGDGEDAGGKVKKVAGGRRRGGQERLPLRNVNEIVFTATIPCAKWIMLAHNPFPHYDL